MKNKLGMLMNTQTLCLVSALSITAFDFQVTMLYINAFSPIAKKTAENVETTCM